MIVIAILILINFKIANAIFMAFWKIIPDRNLDSGFVIIDCFRDLFTNLEHGIFLFSTCCFLELK